MAYAQELPLSLRPDDIWCLILQGVGAYLDYVGEEEGARSIGCYEEGLGLGASVDEGVIDMNGEFNDWSGVFLDEDIGRGLRRTTGAGFRGLLKCRFSTSSRVSKAACRLAVMKSVGRFYSFYCGCRCGIPEIRLEGRVGDWILLRREVGNLKKIGLDWWVGLLEPVLERFVELSRFLIQGGEFGEESRAFWKQIYSYDVEEDPRSSRGWFTVFFPYLYGKDGVTDENGNQGPVDLPEGGVEYPSIEHDALSCGYTESNLVWTGQLGRATNLKLIGGFMGVQQDRRRGTLRPGLGWAVLKED